MLTSKLQTVLLNHLRSIINTKIARPAGKEVPALLILPSKLTQHVSGLLLMGVGSHINQHAVLKALADEGTQNSLVQSQ